MTTIIQQFQNLIDPSTALGAFIISFVAGIVSSGTIGFFAGRSYEKKNSIIAKKAGNINQDIKHSNKSSELSSNRSNYIKAGEVTGDINQDVEK